MTTFKNVTIDLKPGSKIEIPEAETGHSRVCRIHKAAKLEWVDRKKDFFKVAPQ